MAVSCGEEGVAVDEAGSHLCRLWVKLIFLLETHNCKDVTLLDQHLPIIKGEDHAEIMLISKDAIWDGHTEWLQATGQTKACEGLMSNKVVQASPASC